MKSRQTSIIKNRQNSYILLVVILCVFFFATRNVVWIGSKDLHFTMEIIATLLAFFVGVLAIVRYYSKKTNTVLFIGVAFLGTAFLDGYHCLVTASFFEHFFPSPPPSLAPWSWLASRFYLSILLFCSWFVWKLEERVEKEIRVSENHVYFWTGVFTLACFIFFAYYPLPRAYYPELIFSRPEEMLPALFFLLTLIGYLQKGRWRDVSDHFDHWMVIMLIINFMIQISFMAASLKLFDAMFDVAHVLKNLSYICVLVGLLISIFFLFRKIEEGVVKTENTLKLEERSRKQAEKALTESEESKKKLEEQTAELQKMNRVMVDRELKMIDLKKEIKVLKGGLKKDKK